MKMPALRLCDPRCFVRFVVMSHVGLLRIERVPLLEVADRARVGERIGAGEREIRDQVERIRLRKELLQARE